MSVRTKEWAVSLPVSARNGEDHWLLNGVDGEESKAFRVEERGYGGGRQVAAKREMEGIPPREILQDEDKRIMKRESRCCKAKVLIKSRTESRLSDRAQRDDVKSVSQRLCEKCRVEAARANTL